VEQEEGAILQAMSRPHIQHMATLHTSAF